MLLYNNSEYGFTLQYPSTWEVADAADSARREKQAIENSVGVVTGVVDSEVFSVANIVGYRTLGRLSVRYGEFSPAEYLGKTVNYIDENMRGVNLRVDEHLHTETIHGKEFQVAGYAVEIEGVEVQTRMYAAEVQGGSLLFGLTAVENHQLKGLEVLLGTVRFFSADNGGSVRVE
jgi:hypothetical protein